MVHVRIGHADKQATAWAIREKGVWLEQLLTKGHARELVEGTCKWASRGDVQVGWSRGRVGAGL